MEVSAEFKSFDVFYVQARDETEAIQEFNRQNPVSVYIDDYHIYRVRRTFLQRITNALPQWKITYSIKSNDDLFHVSQQLPRN